MEKFDKIKEFEAEVAPLMLQLRDTCKKHGIPMFITCLPYDDDDHTNTRTLVYPGEKEVMQERPAIMQIIAMQELSDLPTELQALVLLRIQNLKDTFKEEISKSIQPADGSASHATHGDEPAHPNTPLEDVMLGEVLKQLGFGDSKEEDK